MYGLILMSLVGLVGPKEFSPAETKRHTAFLKSEIKRWGFNSTQTLILYSHYSKEVRKAEEFFQMCPGIAHLYYDEYVNLKRLKLGWDALDDVVRFWENVADTERAGLAYKLKRYQVFLACFEYEINTYGRLPLPPLSPDFFNKN